MWSDFDRRRELSRAMDTQLIRGVRLSLTIQLARGCKCWHPLAPGRRYGTRSPLSEYMSLHLSLKLTASCGPRSRIKWMIYFYKEVFCSFIDYYTTLAQQPAQECPCVGVHRRTLFVSLSLLHSRTHHAFFVLLVCFVRWEVSGNIVAVSLNVVSRISSKQLVTFMRNFHQGFLNVFHKRSRGASIR